MDLDALAPSKPIGRRAGAAVLMREVEGLSRLGASFQPLLWQAQGMKTLTFEAGEGTAKSPGKDKRKAKLMRREKTGERFEAKGPVEGWAIVDLQWSSLTRQATTAAYRLKKAAQLAKGLPELTAEALPEGMDALRGVTPLFDAWDDSPYRPHALEVLRRHGYDPMLVERIDRKLAGSAGDLRSVIGVDSVEELAERLEPVAARFHDFVQNELALAGSDRERAGTLRLLTMSGNPEIKIDCSWLKDELELVCIIVAIAVIVIAIAVIVGKLIGAWAESWEKDDRARDMVKSSSCEELRNRSDVSLRGLIVDMLEGFTGDADEKAILRILYCLPCDRVRRLVNEIGRGRLLDDIDGAEWDRLMIRLRECGLVSFGEWDDDATRLFVNEVDCSVIARLPEGDIRQLVLNLFDGFTGDDDERAILKIMNCLDCAQIRSLVRRGGMSAEDFDDEVDGEEWDTLEQRFVACGVAV